MTERGILFSAPMVRAILADQKTQTRRTVKLREFGPSTTRGYDWTFRDRRALWNDVSHARLLEKCPYGVPVDRLWVRETWAVGKEYDHLAPRDLPHRSHTCGFHWLVDGPKEKWTGMAGRTRSPIHMPRRASRLTLEITEVRVQRLQDISEEDAIAEGVEPHTSGPWWSCMREDGSSFDASFEPAREGLVAVVHRPRVVIATAREMYARLWDQINGAGSWEKNEWVWVVTFKRVKA